MICGSRLVSRRSNEHGFNAVERAAAAKPGYIEKITHIDVRENMHCMCQVYHRRIRKARSNSSEANKISENNHSLIYSSYFVMNLYLYHSDLA